MGKVAFRHQHRMTTRESTHRGRSKRVIPDFMGCRAYYSVRRLGPKRGVGDLDYCSKHARGVHSLYLTLQAFVPREENMDNES